MASGRKPGRPTKLNDAVQKLIVDAIRNGNYVEVAVRAAGIDPTTYYRWMETGEADNEADKDTPHRAFREAVLHASAAAEADVVQILRDAMPEDWRAAVEWLKRRHRDRWRDSRGLEVDANVTAKAELEVVHNKPVLVIPAPERREQIAQIFHEAVNGGGSAN